MRALVTTLRDLLPAKLVTADASRFAVIACKQGPYTIPASGTLKINTTTCTLTAGARTAAQVAAEITVSGIAASADADGRLLLTATVAPTIAVPSRIEITDGTANSALGLTQTLSNAVRLAIGDPPPIIHEHEIPVGLLPDCPTIGIESLGSKSESPRRGDMATVEISIICIMPGGIAEREATLEAVRALSAEIKSCIRTGDGGGRAQIGGSVYGVGVTSCHHISTIADPQIQREPKTNTYYGVVAERYTIRIWDTGL